MRISIKDCHRCGADHEKLEFKELQRASDRFSEWATCPTTGEPILLGVGGGFHTPTTAIKVLEPLLEELLGLIRGPILNSEKVAEVEGRLVELLEGIA